MQVTEMIYPPFVWSSKFHTLQSEKMNIPRIIRQNDQRWLVVYKPPGWSLGSRASSKSGSVESFLGPILRGSSELFFPIELDTRMSGLGIVCCDRGMQSQFERFKIRGQLHLRFRIWSSTVLSPAQSHVETDAISIEPVESDQGSTVLDLKSSQYITMKKVQGLLKLKDESFGMHLYSLAFPDPICPNFKSLCISLPEVPPDSFSS